MQKRMPLGHFSASLYYLSFILFGLSGAIVGPTLPSLAAQTNTQLDGISFLFIASALGFTLGALLSGRVFDRFSGHPVLTIALLAMSLLLALVPVTPWLWGLLLVMFFIGWMSSVIDVGSNTLIVWIYRHRVGPFLNGLHFAFGLGAFLAPLLVAQVIVVTGSFQWSFWLMALLPLPIAVLLANIPSPRPARNVQEKQTDESNSAKLIVLITAFFFLYTGSEVAFGNWIFTYATGLKLLDDTWAAYLNSGFWGALTVGRLLSIPIAMRFRPSRILWVDLIGCLMSVGLLLLWPNHQGVLWVGTLGLGLFMASIFPSALTLAARRMTITGKVNSYLFSGTGAGTMVLPWLVGQGFDGIGPVIMNMVVGVSLLAALGVLVAFLHNSVRFDQKNSK